MTGLDLCEDEITHTKIWKKHKDIVNLLFITEVKLQKLQKLQNNRTSLNGGSLSLRRDMTAMHIHKVGITKRPKAFLT